MAFHSGVDGNLRSLDRKGLGTAWKEGPQEKNVRGKQKKTGMPMDRKMGGVVRKKAYRAYGMLFPVMLASRISGGVSGFFCI